MKAVQVIPCVDGKESCRDDPVIKGEGVVDCAFINDINEGL